MAWKDRCFQALDEAKLFENSAHRTRFRELLDCYADYPFFTPGVCKCMYLSGWDEEHFCIMLETLTELALGRETDTNEMRIKGDAFLEEMPSAEYYVYKLSNAFLDDEPFQLDVPEEDLPPDILYIIRRALLAAAIIDSI
jgi:hypothetical protein